MILYKIEKNKLFFENNEIIDVNRDIIFEFKLKGTMNISKEFYKEIISAAVLAKAYYYISRRDYSCKELANKLKMKFFKHSEIIEKIIFKLEQSGYLNDYEYAKQYIKNKKFGRKRIEYELYLKGISKALISKIYLNETKEEKENIRKFLLKLKNKDRDKKIAYLLRRGFTLSDILEELKDK